MVWAALADATGAAIITEAAIAAGIDLMILINILL
jgi:hypothetical protein